MDSNKNIDLDQAKQKVGEAAEKVGQAAVRVTADAVTGGQYETVRNAPVVGKVVQKVEKKTGESIVRRSKQKSKSNKTVPNTEDMTSDPQTVEQTAVLKKEAKQEKKRAKKEAKQEKKEIKKAKRAKNIIILILIPLVIFVLPVALLISAIILIASLFGGGMATQGYYAMRCEEVTVIFVDPNNNYETTGTETYPLEEYVAGVIRGEILGFNNLEVYKEFAILARTFVEANSDNCTIEASARRQVFKKLEDAPANSELVYQAVEETKGQVLLENNRLASVQYDAFACIGKDDTYYTISQANQKVPKEWIDSHISESSNPNWFICNGKENLQNHHGNGVSQWGSLYLATKEGYKYNEILNFYLGDNITISRSGFLSSIDGLEIQDTRGDKALTVSLRTFLPTQGTSVEELNSYIKNNVIENGAGTRAGVVTAAVSLPNFLHAMKVTLPYYWGGQYQKVGVNPEFGGETTPRTSIYGDTFYYAGFDCSGFVSWAIRNGGYKMGRKTTHGFHSAFSGDSCDISEKDCIGQPGDLINSRDCHVQMIVAVDEEHGKYYIAESSGGLVMRQVNMHASNCGGEATRILHMDNFYNNPNNVDQNY